MTERKPAGTDAGSWVEQQIRAAEARGEFDALPLAGKPIPGIDRAWDATAWARALAEREGLSTRAMLPPALAIAREREDLPALLVRERSERTVRRLVADFNERLRQVRRSYDGGPPVTARALDVEQVVAQWRAARAPVAPTPAESPEHPEPSEPFEVGRRRWWQRG